MSDVVYSDEQKSRLQRDAGIPLPPTDLTYECRMAVAGAGPRAYDWSNKPHRLVYDLSRRVEAQAAEITRLRAELAKVEGERVEARRGTGFAVDKANEFSQAADDWRRRAEAAEARALAAEART
jgi:hypothetical protein